MAAALADKIQLAIKQDSIPHALCELFEKACTVEPLKPKNTASSGPSPYSLALKVAPTLQARLSKPAPSGTSHGNTLRLAKVCIDAISHLPPNKLQTKKPWSIHKIMLNFAKLLRRYKEVEVAIGCCALASENPHCDEGTSSKSKSAEASRILREAIEQQLHCLLDIKDFINTIQLADNMVKLCSDPESENSQLLSKSCMHTAKEIEKVLAYAKGPDFQVEAIEAALSLRCAALKTGCSSTSTIRSAMTSASRRLDALALSPTPRRVQDRYFDFLSAVSVSQAGVVSSKYIPAASRICAECSWRALAHCGVDRASEILNKANEMFNKATTFDPLDSSASAEELHVANLVLAATSLRIAAAKKENANHAANHMVECAQSIKIGTTPRADYILDGFRDTFQALIGMESLSKDVLDAVNKLSELRIELAQANEDMPSEFGAYLDQAAVLNVKDFTYVEKALDSLEKARVCAYDLRKHDKADTTAKYFNELYKYTRPLFNSMSKAHNGATPPVNDEFLIRCLTLVCDCAQEVGQVDDSRRKSGVLSSLFASLAGLQFNASLRKEASLSAGKAFCFLPFSDLKNEFLEWSELFRRRLNDFVFYGAKAARSLNSQDAVVRCNSSSSEDISINQPTCDPSLELGSSEDISNLATLMQKYGPQLSSSETKAILRAFINACAEHHDPSSSRSQHFAALNSLKELTNVMETPIEYSNLLVEQTVLVYEESRFDEGLAMCKQAIQVLRSNIHPTTKLQEPSSALIEGLASAYSWCGICESGLGKDGGDAFDRACGFWEQLQNEAPSNALSTQRLVMTLATLFGLLGKTNNQILMHKLIEVISYKLERYSGATRTTVPSALAATGNLLQRMGYVGEAEYHFKRAQKLPGAFEDTGFLIYFSEFALAKGDIQTSKHTAQQILGETSNASTEQAAIAAIAADIAHRDGHTAVASALAKQALKLRMKVNSVQESSLWAARSDISQPKTSTYQPLSRLDILAAVFDSLEQTGHLYAVQGFPDAAIFCFNKGFQLAEAAGFNPVQHRFGLALAAVACDRHDFNRAEQLINSAEEWTDSALPVPSSKKNVRSHADTMTMISIARHRGNMMMLKRQYVEAAESFKKAEKMLLEVTDAAYAYAAVHQPSKFEVGSPGLNQLLKSLKKSSRRHDIQDKPVCPSPLRTSEERTLVSQPDKELPKSKVVSAPILCGLLATTKALCAWVRVLHGEFIAQDVLDEVLALPCEGQDAALVHYLVGSIILHGTGIDQHWQPSHTSLSTVQNSLQCSEECAEVTENYSKWLVKELRSKLSSLGLKTSGVKAVLIDRLNEYAENTKKKAQNQEDSHTLRETAIVKDATYHLKRAYEYCLRLPCPPLLRNICFKLALCIGNTDPWQTSFYLHSGQGTTVIQDLLRRRVGKRPLDFGGEDKIDDLLMENSLVSEIDTFTKLGKSQFRSEATIVSVSVDESGTTILLSWLDSGRVTVSRRLLQPQQGVFSSVEAIVDILRKSDEVLASGHEIRGTVDETEKAVRAAEWWKSRSKLDMELGSIIEDLEHNTFGPLRCFFLGEIDSDEVTAALRKAAVELADLINRKLTHSCTSPRAVDPSFCERILDGVIEDTLCIDEFIQAVSTSIGDDATSHIFDIDLRKQIQQAVDSILEVGRKHFPELSKNDLETPLKSLKKKSKMEHPPKSAYQKASKPKLHDVPKLSFDSPKLKQRTARINLRRRPVCLILDARLQILPIESFKVLSSRPVSRVPSVAALAEHTNRGHRNIVDDCKTFYVLNPGKDLVSSQQHFEASFATFNGWTGVSGSCPSLEEYRAALKEKDIVVYVGHGSGQSFFQESQVCDVSCQSTMLLMGCSSGKRWGYGNFEPTGIALQYWLSGAPAVVANLWDVTDTDLDKATTTILEVWRGMKEDGGVGLLEAISTARTRCKMKYLNGAAMVVYGLNVWRKAP